MNYKHGMNKTKEHIAWMNIKRRCSARYRNAKNYCLRGIAVCEEWRDDFGAFLREIGPAPSPAHSVDRVKNELGYVPGNVRWATAKEQANNRRKRREG